jgi:hypothetical protein
MRDANYSLGLVLAGYVANIVLYQSVSIILLVNIHNQISYLNSWKHFQVRNTIYSRVNNKAFFSSKIIKIGFVRFASRDSGEIDLKVKKKSIIMVIFVTLLATAFMLGRIVFNKEPTMLHLDDVCHLVGMIYTTSLLSVWTLSCRATRAASSRLLEELLVCNLK